MVKEKNKIHQVNTEIVKNLRRGKPIDLPLEEWGPILIRKRWTLNYIKRMLEVLKENNYRGRYLLTGPAGSGKTQLLYFLKNILKKENNIKAILINTLHPLRELIDSIHLTVGESLILILDNLDDYMVKNPDESFTKLNTLINEISKKVKTQLEENMAIIISIRTETLNYLQEIFPQALDVLKKYEVILNTDISKEDLMFYKEDLLKILSYIISGEAEKIRIIKSFLKAITSYLIEKNTIGNLNQLLISFFDNLEFIKDSLLGDTVSQSLKVSRRFLLEKLSEVVINYLESIDSTIEVLDQGYKVNVETVHISGKEREAIQISSIFNLTLQPFKGTFNLVIMIRLMDNELLPEIETLEKTEAIDAIILISTSTYEEKFDEKRFISLPKHVLKFMKFISHKNTKILVLDKLRLRELLDFNLRKKSYFEISRNLVRKPLSEMSNEDLDKIVYMTIDIIVSELLLYSKRFVSMEIFKTNFNITLENLLGIKIDEKIINIAFETLISGLSREGVLQRQDNLLLVNRIGTRKMKLLLDKVARETSFKIRFYLL